MEQSLALAVKPAGVDMDELWNRKVAALRKTAGLDIALPKVNFTDLRGARAPSNFWAW